MATVCQAGGEYSTAKRIYGRIRQAYIAPDVAFGAGELKRPAASGENRAKRGLKLVRTGGVAWNFCARRNSIDAFWDKNNVPLLIESKMRMKKTTVRIIGPASVFGPFYHFFFDIGFP